jgi:hypothetical protein
MAPDQTERSEDGEIQEPPNSTVDDWFGQNVARDQDVADKAVDEAGGDIDEAEERFDKEAKGKERYEEGHDRPEGST